MTDLDRLADDSESTREKSPLTTRDSRLETCHPQLDARRSQLSVPRVLFVDQTAQLGGAELCLKDIVCNRSLEGNDRVILFQSGPLEDSLRMSGIDVMVCPLGSRAATTRKGSGLTKKVSAVMDTISLSRRVAAVARQFDVIYANTPKALVVSAIAGRLARRPVIYHLHDILSHEHFSKSNVRLLVQLANRFCHVVIANSHATADAFAAAGGRREKVSVIYNGFELSKFEVDQCKQNLQMSNPDNEAMAVMNSQSVGERDALVHGPPDLARSLNWPKAAKTVAVFGRLAPWKGQHVAIEAIRDLHDVHLLLVGEALFGEDSYVETLHELANSSSTHGRVHFLGFREDVIECMRLADVVVHCSTAPEPFGRVIVEAMLAERPVIASGAGGAAEIVTHGKTGLLTPPGDSDALAVAITQSLSDTETTRSRASKARSEAVERFDLTARVDEINRLIESVVARSNRLPDTAKSK